MGYKRVDSGECYCMSTLLKVPYNVFFFKKMHFILVPLYRVLIGGTILRLLLETGLPFVWSSEPHEGLAVCRAKAVPSFLSYFKTLSVGPASGIEPPTSRSAVKHSVD